MRNCPRDVQRPSVLKIVALFVNGGRRESRVHAAPAVSCAGVHKEVGAHEHTGQRRHSGLPCAMVYDLYVLALVRLCFCVTIVSDRR